MACIVEGYIYVINILFVVLAKNTNKRMLSVFAFVLFLMDWVLYFFKLSIKKESIINEKYIYQIPFSCYRFLNKKVYILVVSLLLLKELQNFIIFLQLEYIFSPMLSFCIHIVLITYKMKKRVM